MIIRKVRVQRFGRLLDCEFTFQSGLNVIKGPNEAGKSTLQQAILMALFERPTKKKATRAFQSWGHNRLYTLEIEFEDHDDYWNLSKDFEQNQAVLTNGVDKAMVILQEVTKELTDILGTSSGKMFQSTVFVAQNALSAIESGQKEISRSLETIVTGGDQDVNTQQALTKLDKVIKTYRRGYETRIFSNPGPIAGLIERQAEQEREIRELEAKLTIREQAETELKDVRDRQASLETEMADRQALQAAVDQLESCQNELESWREQESRLDKKIGQVKKAQQERLAAQDARTTLGPIATLSRADQKELLQWKIERQQLLDKIHAAPVVQEKSRSVSDEKTDRIGAGWLRRGLGGLVALVGLVLAAGGVLLPSQTIIQAIVAGVGGLLLLVGILLVIWPQHKRLPSQSAQGDMWPETTATTLAPEAEALEQLQRSIAGRLQVLGCADWAEYQRKTSKLEQADNEIELAETTLSTLLVDGGTLEALHTKRKNTSKRRRDFKEKLEEPALRDAAQLSALERQQLRSKLNSLAEEKESLVRRHIELETKLNSISVSRERLIQAEETLAVVQAELERCKDRLKSYQMAREYLIQAQEETLIRARDQLGPKTGDYLKILTAGRYDRVAIGSKLDIQIHSDHKPDGLIMPTELSKGTQDQLYLAARLALADVLFVDVKPPLFFDDPFVKFDSTRRQAAAKLCVEIAQERQVFLFTCHDDYDDLGHLVEMTP